MTRYYNLQKDTESDVVVYENSCLHCGEVNQFTMDEADYHAWKIEKTYLQTVFPHLSPDQRELLISGVHDTCWNEIFSEDPDDEPLIDEILQQTNDQT